MEIGTPCGISTPTSDANNDGVTLPTFMKTGGETSPMSDVGSGGVVTGCYGSYELVELEIKRYGYEPVQRFTFNRDAQPTECYIKARSPYGFYVFILIDQKSLMSFSNRDLSMVENKTLVLTDISNSVKRGIYSSANGDVIAECQGGICRLSHNPVSTDPIETTFTFVSSYTPNKIIPKGSILAYPVIRLSELKVSADVRNLLLKRTLEETVRMRGTAHSESKEDIKKFLAIKNAVDVTTKTYIAKYNKIREIISTDLPMYTEIQHKFVMHPPSTDRDMNESRRNSAQLSLINDTFVNYVTSTHEFKHLAQDLNKIGTRIAELNEQLDKYILTISTKVEVPVL